MRFTVVTLFPDMFDSFLAASLLGKARGAGLVTVDFVDPRDFTSDAHRTVDDAPYGGGAGMVMKVEPMVAAIEAAGAGAGASAAHRIMLTPSGRPLDQQAVRRLAALEHIVLVCGRYEGPDERIIELAIDELISIGDYVLSGGEPAAMVVIDAVARLVPGVLGSFESTEEESFEGGLLEYPHYTRPLEYRGRSVPDVLRSGNHAAIAAWRREQSIARTVARRPELIGVADAARAYVALLHFPVLDRTGAEVTSSVTNLDIHDIARSATTYGLAGYFAVSPIESQREKIRGIAETWAELARSEIGDHRHQALSLLEAVPVLEDAVDLIKKRHRGRPVVVATSARGGDDRIDAERLRATIAAEAAPILIVFGTGWGLADRIVSEADLVLAPIQGDSDFNHLAVRSAVAVVLDRLFGGALPMRP